MKDVVTAAPRRPRVLVTGFGAFPGAPTNPTLDVLRRLAADGVEGADLILAQLPVTFAGVGPALRAAARCRPDAVLLLGLATRRRILNVETVARNLVGTAMPDAEGHVPACATLSARAPASRAATWPAAAVLAALHRAGHAATLSDDAGDYVCNAALFHALDGEVAPVVGFLHVPPVAAPFVDDAQGATAETLAEAARVVVGVLAARHSLPAYSAARAG